MPELLDHVAGHLPVLFSAEQLQAESWPLLEPTRDGRRVEQIHSGLAGSGRASGAARRSRRTR